MKKEQNVLERVYEPGRLLEAWRQVKRNAGAAGVDQMTVTEFERRKEELFPLIRGKLIAGTYRFKPARRVSIPKEGTPGKFRNLGIPVVMDRIVAQSVHATLDEIYDSGFSPGNFGFPQREKPTRSHPVCTGDGEARAPMVRLGGSEELLR